MKTKTIAAFALTSAFFVGCEPGGCFSPGGIFEDVQNCVQICDQYQDCEDSTFDRTECADRCEARADFDEDFQLAADRCENCLDSGSCAEQADICSEDCDPIIREADQG